MTCTRVECSRMYLAVFITKGRYLICLILHGVQYVPGSKYSLIYLEHIEVAIDSGVVAGGLVPVTPVLPGPLEDVKMPPGRRTPASRPVFDVRHGVPSWMGGEEEGGGGKFAEWFAFRRLTLWSHASRHLKKEHQLYSKTKKQDQPGVLLLFGF